MDFYTTARCLYTLLIWAMYTAQTRSRAPPRWLVNLLHSHMHPRTKRFDFGQKSEHQTPERYLKKDCCHNRGVCVLGSFCQCTGEFYGRYCQHRLKSSKCGPVQHGEWWETGCSLCRCYNGHPLCLDGVYGKPCDASVLSKDYNPADPSNIIKIHYLEPGESYLENSWATTKAPSSVERTRPHLVFLAVTVLVLGTGIA